MEQYLPIIANFGFPIAMTLWFMFRTEKVIKEHTSAIHDLVHIISEIRDHKAFKH